MADSELAQVRTPESITINVIRARDLFQHSLSKSGVGHPRAPLAGGGSGGGPTQTGGSLGKDRIQSALRTESALNRGQRGEVVTSLVKVEFGEKLLGESPKVDCGPGQPAEFNYNSTLPVTFDDPLTLDEIATKPIVLTVIEVLPKEKKQKEEKTVVLGQCSVDLLPLILGEVKHRVTLQVSAVSGSPLEALTPDMAKPELDISLSLDQPLLTEAQLNDSNLVTMTAESIYSPPDSWTLVGAQYMYTACAPVPVTSEKENVVVYTAGQLKPSQDKEPTSKQRRWAMPGQAQGNAVYIPDRNLAQDAIEEEDGDFKGKDDREHRVTSEQDKNRVTWNIERRCFLDHSGSKSFQDKIAKTRYWPVEVFRTALPSAGKAKKEDEGHISFHGIAYVNLAPLLYPGVKRIRGAYKVVAYNDQELTEKTQRKGSLAEEALKIANGILSRSSSSPYPKQGKGSKEDAKLKDPKKGRNTPSMSRMGTSMSRIGTSLRMAEKPQEGDKDKTKTKDKGDKEKEIKASSMKASDAASEADGGQVVNAEGMQYGEAQSYVMLEISLHRPLVPKRPAEELAKRVADYIPPRPLFPKRTDGAQRAVNDLHGQVGNVANLILDEFRDSVGDGGSGGTGSSMEERRQKLIYQLNSSGKYFAFKEQLKHAVVKIVREKYLKTTNFKGKDELQTFLSELNVYLVDQMNVGLSRVLAIEDQSPIPEPLTDSAQLKHFAREAEVNENFVLAAKYYQERIARERNDPNNWLDYGTFCLYINDYTKAEECFKECVSIDQRHLHGLLLYGVVCHMQDKNQAAETFFEAATAFEPKNILAWTMLGIFYDRIGNEIGTEMAILEANKLNMAAAMAAARAAREEEQRQKERERELERERQRHRQESEQTIEGPTVPVVTSAGETAAGVEGENGGTDSNKDGASAGDPLAIRATPTSVAGSDKKVKARGGSALRGKSVAQPGGRYAPNLGTVLEPTTDGVDVSKGPRPSRAGKHVTVIDPKGDVREKGQLGNRVKSNDTMASRPGSVPNPGGVAGEDADGGPPREPTPVPTHTIYMQAIDFLLEVKAVPFTECALAHHLLDPLGGTSAAYFIVRARLELQRHQLEEAETSLSEALQFDHQNPDAWAILGHVKFLLNDTEMARDCYERTLAFVADAAEMHSIYLRLASIYLAEGQFDKAKRQFLMACKRSPSCVSWLGVGIACYRLGELSEAENALSEANILNNTDPEVWAYLSLVCLRTGRQLEAEQAYKYAIKLNLEQEEVLNELHAVQEEVGFGNPQL